MNNAVDHYFEFNTVPKFVHLAETSDAFDPVVENFFKRSSSGIQADFESDDAENMPPGPAGDKHMLKIEFVPEEEMEKAEAIPELDQTMNNEDEAEIINNLANDLKKLSMFSEQPKKIRRSQIEQEERKAAAKEEQQQPSDRYNLRQRTPSQSAQRTNVTTSNKKPSIGRQRFTASKTTPRPPTPRSGSVEPQIRGRTLDLSTSHSRSRSTSMHTARAPSTTRRAPSAEPVSRLAKPPTPQLNKLPTPQLNRPPTPCLNKPAPVKRTSAAPPSKAGPVRVLPGAKVPPVNKPAAQRPTVPVVRRPSAPSVRRPSGALSSAVVKRTSVPATRAAPESASCVPTANTSVTRPVASSVIPKPTGLRQPGVTPVTRMGNVSRLASNKPTQLGQPTRQGGVAGTPKRAPQSTGLRLTNPSPLSWVERLSRPKMMTPTVVAARESRLEQRNNSVRQASAARQPGHPLRIAKTSTN
ncbi:unnamed protein product, partial [Mesorhabditis belari]|uniref:Uncharacterized protein n=1 Tax=Mesorhabditis belari TaxID=2138241 RepID=A0AAF3FCM9_9BILA